jgi:hypothetical protein
VDPEDAGRTCPRSYCNYAAREVAGEFLGRLRAGTLATDVACGPHSAVNLLAATAIWARLPIAEHELRQDILVLKLRPVFDGQ